jgi:hypothetical protein
MKSVLTWDGKKTIGSLRVISSWRAPPRCFTTSRFYLVRAIIDREKYGGWTNGMLVRLRRLKNQRTR